MENEDNDFETSKIDFTAETTSIDTNNADRDEHLGSAEFFESDVYPKLSFVSTSIKKKSGNEYEIHGDLTLKNVTKNIVLDTEYSGLMTDPWGRTKAGLSISGKINRKDFGLTWNAALETGGVLVGEEIKLASEIQFIKQ